MKRKDIVTGILVLLLIASISGFLLAQTFRVAKPRIQKQMKIEEEKLNREIFPEGNDFRADNFKGIKCTSVYDGQDAFIGRIFNLTAPGYGGNILVKAGIDSESRITGIRILEHKETPGLGSRITEASFLDQFRNRDSSTLFLKKDSPRGNIDAITGATISSRAVTDSVRKLQEQINDTDGETP